MYCLDYRKITYFKMPFYTAVDHVDEENEKEQILPNSNKNLLTNKTEKNLLYFQICMIKQRSLQY